MNSLNGYLEDRLSASVWGFTNAYELVTIGKTWKTDNKSLKKLLLYFSGMQESYSCPNFALKASILTTFLTFFFLI